MKLDIILQYHIRPWNVTLQSVHADDVPEGQSKTDHLIGPTVILFGFTQLIDLSDDWIHGPVIQIEATLHLPGLVCVGAS